MATIDARLRPVGWGWMMGLGVALVVLGIIMLGDAFLATLASTVVFGWLLVIGGVVQIIHAFSNRGWAGTLLHVALGALYIVAGLMLAANPVAGAVTLTLLVAFFLFVAGLFRLGTAAALRLPGWGWVVAGGVVDVILAILILAHWPSTALWVIGLFVGIEMLLAGFSNIFLALDLRRPQPGMADERWRPAA